MKYDILDNFRNSRNLQKQMLPSHDKMTCLCLGAARKLRNPNVKGPYFIDEENTYPTKGVTCPCSHRVSVRHNQSLFCGRVHNCSSILSWAHSDVAVNPSAAIGNSSGALRRLLSVCTQLTLDSLTRGTHSLRCLWWLHPEVSL